jgi:hypothetical protein
VSTSLTPDDREHKLPVWAQDIINGLRREIVAGERINATLQWQNPGTDTRLDTILDKRDMELPKGATINFSLDPKGRDEHHVSIHARVRRDRDGKAVLYLMGGDGLVVEPEASNCIAVSLKR